MRRFTSVLAFTLAFLGCGSSVESTSSQSAGGIGGTSGTSTSTSIGGSSSTASEGGASGGSGGTGGAVCNVPGPHPCTGPIDPFAYPDDSLSFAPDALYVTEFAPLPGESPKGAAASLLGPFFEERQSIAMEVVLAHTAYCKLPDPVRYAIWTENQCGVPTIDPYAISQEVPLGEVEQQDINAEAVRLTIPLVDQPITVPAGSALYVALILTEPTVCVGSFEAVSGVSSRALWFGRSDLNCDGKTDADLGWAWLREPTDSTVAIYGDDLGFGVQF